MAPYPPRPGGNDVRLEPGVEVEGCHVREPPFSPEAGADSFPSGAAGVVKRCEREGKALE